MKIILENTKEWITYRTSTVWTSPIVEGIPPLKRFPSNNLSGRKIVAHSTIIVESWEYALIKSIRCQNVYLHVYEYHLRAENFCRNWTWKLVLVEMAALHSNNKCCYNSDQYSLTLVLDFRIWFTLSWSILNYQLVIQLVNLTYLVLLNQ